jgi:hypothetical protein
MGDQEGYCFYVLLGASGYNFEISIRDSNLLFPYALESLFQNTSGCHVHGAVSLAPGTDQYFQSVPDTGIEICVLRGYVTGVKSFAICIFRKPPISGRTQMAPVITGPAIISPICRPGLHLRILNKIRPLPVIRGKMLFF